MRVLRRELPSVNWAARSTVRRGRLRQLPLCTERAPEVRFILCQAMHPRGIGKPFSDRRQTRNGVEPSETSETESRPKPFATLLAPRSDDATLCSEPSRVAAVAAAAEAAEAAAADDEDGDATDGDLRLMSSRSSSFCCCMPAEEARAIGEASNSTCGGGVDRRGLSAGFGRTHVKGLASAGAAPTAATASGSTWIGAGVSGCEVRRGASDSRATLSSTM